MSSFRPSLPYNVPIQLLIPIGSKTVKGVAVKTYADEGELLYCSYKTYGGTEAATNGVVSVENTGYVETWYRPDIKADCRIKFAESGSIYEILGEPENIDMRNQFCKFKVKVVKGGA